MSEDASDNTQFRSLQVPHSVDYAVCPRAGDVESTTLLLALHGWGQNCERFSRWIAPLAHALSPTV